MIESFRFFSSNGKKSVSEQDLLEIISKQFKNLLRKNNQGYGEDEDKKRVLLGVLHGSKCFEKNAFQKIPKISERPPDGNWSLVEEKAQVYEREKLAKLEDGDQSESVRLDPELFLTRAENRKEEEKEEIIKMKAKPPTTAEKIAAEQAKTYGLREGPRKDSWQKLDSEVFSSPQPKGMKKAASSLSAFQPPLRKSEQPFLYPISKVVPGAIKQKSKRQLEPSRKEDFVCDRQTHLLMLRDFELIFQKHQSELGPPLELQDFLQTLNASQSGEAAIKQFGSEKFTGMMHAFLLLKPCIKEALEH